MSSGIRSAARVQGDFIEVLSKPFVDWWMGRVSHTGRTGLFCTLMVDCRPLGKDGVNIKPRWRSEYFTATSWPNG